MLVVFLTPELQELLFVIHSAVRIGIHCSPGFSSLVKELGFVLWCGVHRGRGVDLHIARSNLLCSYSAGDL